MQSTNTLSLSEAQKLESKYLASIGKDLYTEGKSTILGVSILPCDNDMWEEFRDVYNANNKRLTSDMSSYFMLDGRFYVGVLCEFPDGAKITCARLL